MYVQFYVLILTYNNFCNVITLYELNMMLNMVLTKECGAEGVGLLRSEFLYLDRQTLPTETEEYETYQAIAKIMGTRPLTIRTLDIGGDKTVSYIKMESEPNPFLGCRGLRQSLETPEILQTQLRAMMKNTIPMLAKKGRASYLGDRSVGHQDPGATSIYLTLKTLLDIVEKNGVA